MPKKTTTTTTSSTTTVAPAHISLLPQDWILWKDRSTATAYHPDTQDSGWRTIFPQAPSSLGYAFTQCSGQLSGSIEIDYSIKFTSGPPEFVPADPDDVPPCYLRLFMWKTDFYGNPDWGPSGRWWAYQSRLEPGEVIWRVPLRVDTWSNVNGQRADYSGELTNAFWSTVDTHRRIGFTLGGLNFAGHGVGVTGGDASFYLLNYRLV